jgi:hypothetical protein
LAQAVVEGIDMLNGIIPSRWSRLIGNQRTKHLPLIQLPHRLSRTGN